MPNKIENIVDKELCTGCGACAHQYKAASVEMHFSTHGFLRPVLKGTLTQIEVNRFNRICPALALNLQTSAPQVHPEWGPLHALQTGWSTDEETRHKGSSGGVLSAILIYLLESNQADFIVHTAVSAENPTVNKQQISRTRTDVLAGAGSRYAPAAPLQNITELFRSGERFAFVGKPCDVAALRAYIREYPQYESQVVAMLSFMCAGVPSIEGTHKILEQLGTASANLKRFQYRGNGWPGLTIAETKDGQQLSMDYNTAWGKILGKYLQLRCKLCPDGTGEFADIVCADAWYGLNGYPDFNEREGRSLILARTHKGMTLLEQAIKHKAIETEATTTEQIDQMQPYQLTRKRVVVGRWLAVAIRLHVIPNFTGLRLWRSAIRGGLLPVLRNGWGMFKRL